jgi:hypothetical protein
MKKLNTIAASVALVVGMASFASAQVVATGPVGSLPPQIQALIANAGGAGVVASVTLAVVATGILVTIVSNDGTVITTTVAP